MEAASFAPKQDLIAPIRERLRPAIELLTVVGLLELELWYLRSHGAPWLNVLSYGALIATIGLSAWRRSIERLKFANDPIGIRRAWVEVSLACLVLCLMLVASARMVGDANETFEFVFLDKPPIKLLSWLAGKFVAALGQQLALQLFLWPVCFEVTRSRFVGTLLAASIFGLIHLPSPILVSITLLGGCVWIVLYQRTGRLAPLVVSHMILATLAHGSLPERLTYDMRVGLTATADLKRFDELKDPRIRQINRRLKENRARLKHFTSDEYYAAQGGEMAGFVRGVYRDILDRPAGESDISFWQERKLANPRVDIVSIMLASDEYAAILGRRAQANGRARRQ